ncbi:MAG: glucose-1-phosphate adenylyltransferase [Ketobacteraceae bacterium]|nr:glucose-1-phosphate adenylyltransferase [Ketobacteraceae bacterium]
MKGPFSLHPKSIIRDTFALILAGGSGSRLRSLTKWHAKPSIPFGGKFRTIDFPLSNCINSDIRRIGILTQYKSHSLNSHIQKGWSFLRPELGEFIDLIPAQQRVKDSWYQGTADAIFQNIDIIREVDPAFVLVLAGDHIYKMDYSLMIQHHIDTDADMTVGCIEVPLDEAREFGVMSIDTDCKIQKFSEKPANPDSLPNNPELALASMGIYVFSTEFLYNCLETDADISNSHHDFGKDIIPRSLRAGARIFAYPFRDPETSDPGYWRDVGTIDAYYEANMELLAVTPDLNLYDETWPIWTYQSQLPPAKFVFDDNDRRGIAIDSLVSGGCIVSGSVARRCLLSNNVRIHSYSQLQDSVILPNSSVGRHCRLKKVIIDQHCNIPEGMEIGYDHEKDAEHFYVSPKGVVLVSPDMLRSLTSRQREVAEA